MTIIIPEDHVQFTCVWSSPNWDSGGGATILGFSYQDTPGLPAGVEAFIDGVVDYMLPRTTDTVILQEVQWRTATTGGVQLVAAPGLFSSSVGSPNISMLLKKTTQSRGRRARGRAFWPQMVSEANVDESGIIGTTDLNAIQLALDNATGEWATGGLEQVVLQNEEGQTPPLDPPPVVSSFTVDPKVATQRRRLRR